MLLPALAFAQTETSPPPMPFQETVEVRVMDLDVAVTDSRGPPTWPRPRPTGCSKSSAAGEKRTCRATSSSTSTWGT
jgi:hypothetical protein